MQKNFRWLLFIVLACSACDHVYKKYDKESFPTYTWNSEQAVAFSPTIKDISKSYKLIVGIRHLYGLQVNTINLVITITSPSGKRSTQNHQLTVRDSANKPLGKCAGDLCDLEEVVRGNMKFEEAGEYNISIRHAEQGYRIPGIMEVGLIVDESNDL